MHLIYQLNILIPTASLKSISINKKGTDVLEEDPPFTSMPYWEIKQIMPLSVVSVKKVKSENR